MIFKVLCNRCANAAVSLLDRSANATLTLRNCCAMTFCANTAQTPRKRCANALPLCNRYATGVQNATQSLRNYYVVALKSLNKCFANAA
jgi:hypothetical protein